MFWASFVKKRAQTLSMLVPFAISFRQESFDLTGILFEILVSIDASNDLMQNLFRTTF